MNLKNYSGFDASKVSNLSSGSIVENGIQWDSASDVPKQVTYNYDISNNYKLKNKKMSVKIILNEKSETEEPEPDEPKPLGVPVLFSAANVTTGINLAWEGATSANGYIVYRKQSGQSEYKAIKKINSAFTHSFADTTVKSGTTYTYKIAAYKGNEIGVKSNAMSRTFVGTTKILSAVNASTGITLTWKRVSGATKYEIYRKASGSSTYSKVKTITSGSIVKWADTKANSNGKTYQYYIVACKGSVKGANSATEKGVYVNRPAISKISGQSGGKMLVQWKKNSAASGYQIRYGTNSSMSGAKTVTITSKNTISKIISGKKGKKYYVQIRAYKTVSGKKYYSAWSTKIGYTVTK